MKCVLFALALIGCSLADPLDFDQEIEFVVPESLKLEDFISTNGSDSDRIVGGLPIQIVRVPWQLSLRVIGRHNCGGSILTATRGLTAAHCLNPQAPSSIYSVVAGTVSLHDVSDGVTVQVSRHIVHPKWDRPTIRNDVGVLWFATPFTFSQRIRPIPLPEPNAAVPYGVVGIVSGWGVTRELGEVSPVLLYTVAQTFTNRQCNQAYFGRVTAEMVCAGVPGGGRGTCSGDSGGALVVNGVQVGIVSWARGCARPNFPSVFARAAFFTEWIRSVM